MASHPVTVARFSYPYEAYLFKGLLESRHLTAFIADEHLITMQWMWETALGGIKVQVAAEDLELARAVLADYEADRLVAEVDTAPADVPTDEQNSSEARPGRGWRALAVACWASTGVVFPLPGTHRHRESDD
ncbi:putative signal transducing protein [Larsenimonas rhizosphaerae]|uniref:DUF2007 domain-containing protein n=1 Tax=Larsenimonas rhizosphaerae TaxID=2944682 RepID=A0AA42CTY4_9GAMM|nr:DUF2007 domain-containing protein [Larsenimonas rhizosphaerae]MCX2524077.1 DUF2007 domain-containing protein [Larsenimonas rhizosphaerae]